MNTSIAVGVEGMSPSGGQPATDPHLNLGYGILGGSYLLGPDGDRRLTVIKVDMDVDTVQDTDGYNTTEEIMPGGYIPVGQMKDLIIRKVAGTTAEPNVTLVWNSPSIRVWDYGVPDPNYPVRIMPGTTIPDANLPKTLRVEGYQASPALRYTSLPLESTLGSTTFKDEIKLTVVGIEKIPLGSSAVLSQAIIGKIYVPTNHGGLLTLDGTLLMLYYIDGADLTYTRALQILKGELEGSIVSAGSPCEYEVPQGGRGWYYVKIRAATFTSISSSFLEWGMASKTPWNGWYWPSLDSAGANLYEQTGDYTPLKDYDTVYGTANRAAEQALYSGGQVWEGHCWGWTIASIAMDQPAATTKNGVVFNQEEMEGLYTELGEGAGGGIEYVLGHPQSPQIPAGPPTSDPCEPLDAWVGRFHRCLNLYIGTQQKCLAADLRASSTGNPNAIWNHPIYKYVSLMEEAPGGNERIIAVATEITSGADAPQFPSDGASRSDFYVYVLEYDDSGDIDTSSSNQNWIQATAYAPLYLATVNAEYLAWGPMHCSISKTNVDSLGNP